MCFILTPKGKKAGGETYKKMKLIFFCANLVCMHQSIQWMSICICLDMQLSWNLFFNKAGHISIFILLMHVTTCFPAASHRIIVITCIYTSLHHCTAFFSIHVLKSHVYLQAPRWYNQWNRQLPSMKCIMLIYIFFVHICLHNYYASQTQYFGINDDNDNQSVLHDETI